MGRTDYRPVLAVPREPGEAVLGCDPSSLCADASGQDGERLCVEALQRFCLLEDSRQFREVGMVGT